MEVEALAAGLKAYATWHTTRTLQAAREACGGQGYLVANRLPRSRRTRTCSPPSRATTRC